MNKVEYNGWTNYETWLINLHMTNEQGGTDFTMEFLAGRPDNFVVYKRNTVALAKFLQDRYETDATSVLSHDLTCRTFDMNLLWKDLINSALSEVNWMEIAIHRVEEWEEMQDD
tara:strand:+ start:196 stop:537 length:342 start_codon:yes stop_codon:yes gene_type:complete